MPELRIVDAGTVSAARSQSFWHGIAAAMTEDIGPTLSFCRSVEPYVCIGFHRALDELDLAACGDLGLPVIRRQIGGGPVYVDRDQLFFQLTVPAAQAPVRIDRLYRSFLAPAVAAFRALGLDAELRGLNDIAVGECKISGTGAGRIGDAVTVVGNVIFRFPHRKMAAVMALPHPARAEYELLMERYVSSLADQGLEAIGSAEAKSALIDAYCELLDYRPVPTALSAREDASIAEWDTRLTDGQWLAGRQMPRSKSTIRQVKVNADVWLLVGADGDLEVQATIVDGKFQRAIVASPRLNGDGTAMGLALVGTPADRTELHRNLESFGAGGRRLAELLDPGLTLR